MSSKKVVIELRSHRLDVVVYERNKRVGSHRVPLELPSEASLWVKAVRQCESQVRDAVRELGLKDRTPASVLYRSPSQAVDLCSLPIKNAGAALEAARLESLDALGYTDTTPVCEAMIVGRDRNGSRDVVHTHVVVACDREDVIASLVAMVEGAGLAFVSATPIEAAIMSRMSAQALNHAGEFGASLYVGESSSYFFLGAKGALLLGRRIGLGLDSLVSSLMRPIRIDQQQAAIEFPLAKAQSMLFSVGVPRFDQKVNDDPPMLGKHIIPVMQPIFQRLVVEMRQSLRFGVPAEFNQAPAIAVQGPGSRVPGLVGLLHSELQLATSVDENYSQFDPAVPGSRGSELVDALRESAAVGELNLQPSALVVARTTERMKRWLWTGAAAAIALLVVDFVSYDSMLSDARFQAERSASRRSIEENREMQQRLAAGIAAIHEIENTVNAELATRPDYRAVLQELSLLTPEHVRLTSLALSLTEGRTHGSLSGFALGDPQSASGGGGTLAVFIQGVRQSPLFTDVTLGNVQAGSVAGGQGERFDARFVALDAPAVEAEKHVVDATEEPGS